MQSFFATNHSTSIHFLLLNLYFNPTMKSMLFTIFILLMINSCNCHLHSKSSNELKVVEEGYINWVKTWGSLKHTSFQEAKNKLKPCKTIKVHKNSKNGDFTSIQQAINSIPIFNQCRVVIYVAKGIYREKVKIPSTMAYITIQGASMKKTIIVWDDTANRLGKNGKPLGTYGSATFAVNSPYFIAKNITFKNKAAIPRPGELGKQAVAMRISGDTAAFIHCKFVGAQDTLYDHQGRHYFKNCHIQGSVDFIFGNGLSLYEGCHLHAKTNAFGALTAQKRDSLLEDTGFSFVNCKVTGSGALYLGRAWGTFSRVVFAYTYMDKIILPRGWYDWGDKNRQMTVFFGQFKCSGPGANHGGRVSWSRELTQEEAQPFVSLSFINGHEWINDF